ncbi:MAG: hypothetical protein RL223_4693 [Pseudomonadota bacterium]
MSTGADGRGASATADAHLKRSPSGWPRRVLFCVCGLSPQVVTETVYALAVAGDGSDRFVPTEVHVLTTTAGAQRLRLALLSDVPGAFARLRRDYALPDIAFTESHIHCVPGADGQPLADIRTDDDNAHMADAVSEHVRRLTADPDCALHVSIAGGRKTMGYYAGYALSLFGREQDRLSHVLVSAPFESSLEFFYPTPAPHVIATQGGRELADASTAQVTLAQIPFVRLRPMLPESMLQPGQGFAAAVAAAEARLAPPHLVLDVSNSSLTADGIEVPLPPWQFSIMAVLAGRARRGLEAIEAPLKTKHDEPWAQQFMADLRAVVGWGRVPGSVERKLQEDCTGEAFASHLSHLRKNLRKALGPERERLYFDDGGTPRNKRYRIPLAPQAIEIRGSAMVMPASLPNAGSS